MINTSESIGKAKEIIASVKGKNYSLTELKDPAIELASLLLKEAQKIQTPEEKHQQSELARMMEDPKGKQFVFSITDQCFRSQAAARTADQMVYIMKDQGIPKFPSAGKRLGLQLFKWMGCWLPRLFVPLTKAYLRRDTSKVILPGEPRKLSKHMAQRRREGVRINLNHLGEAILGEEEAKRRFQTYMDDLKKPDIEYISIKISTIYSQINSLAWDETLEVLSERLRELYRCAQANRYVHPDGRSTEKFVNLDMEEYRDLSLTVELFCKVLSEPEFASYSAGLVLQAYLPDAFIMQQRLTGWAIRRYLQGGAPIKIRIVKGANLAMEQVEASLRGWPQAPYSKKGDVDANYKQMLQYGCMPENARAVQIGVGSHNLFDISLALLLRSQNSVESMVNFEMLEGMADNIRRSIQKITGDVLLYCPAATNEEFQNAIAYLIRRLDENTAPDNFLRHLFGLRSGSKEWLNQAALFQTACLNAGNISNEPRRSQNRLESIEQPELCQAFYNEPDTDWSLPHNGTWAKQILEEWKVKENMDVPLGIAGKLIPPQSHFASGFDPSDPKRQIYRYALATPEDVETALKASVDAQAAWQMTTPAQRSAVLAAIAQKLREKRSDLIGAMIADGGKTVFEADVEISEAIDFAEYYRRNIEELHGLEDISWKPKGTVLVAPPWNFPCSIPIGCITAALAAGNTVIFKPATATALVGWILAEILWDAGVDRNVLQFFLCEDEPIGSMLIKDKRIAQVLLTGATATAELFLNMRPDLDLIAETGGKNAIIVSSLADRDLAIKEIVASAFGHAGQKCSACSLVILEAEVYDDPHFLDQLKDAASSLTVGSAWLPTTKINPLIMPAAGALEKALTTLENGEEWLLKPKQDQLNSQLWSPGIVLGVKEGSVKHQTEFFGPLLSVMRADNMEHAIKLVNGTPYGLTSGLHSLDPREQKIWIENIEAGNCYINRSITGAIVQRQPFGGCKASSFGRGAKAGGPNYLIQLMHSNQVTAPKEKAKLGALATELSAMVDGANLSTDELQLWHASVASYAFYWNGYFTKDHDPSKLVGQDNLLRYHPLKQLTMRITESDSLLQILLAATAALTVQCPLEISADAKQMERIKNLKWPAEAVKFKEESEDELIGRINKNVLSHLRVLSKPGTKLLQAIAASDCRLLNAPVLSNGRLELLNYLREVSISIDYHRYGNLGARENEKRQPLVQPQQEAHQTIVV